MSCFFSIYSLYSISMAIYRIFCLRSSVSLLPIFDSIFNAFGMRTMRRMRNANTFYTFRIVLQKNNTKYEKNFVLIFIISLCLPAGERGRGEEGGLTSLCYLSALSIGSGQVWLHCGLQHVRHACVLLDFVFDFDYFLYVYIVFIYFPQSIVICFNFICNYKIAF